MIPILGLYLPVLLDEPFLLAFVDGLCEIGLGGDDSRVSRFRVLILFGLTGVVRPLVANHVTDEEHQSAQDGEDHHSNNA